MNGFYSAVKDNSLAGDIAKTLTGTALIALASLITIPLPFNPVPAVTMQTIAMVLAGAILGPKRGLSAVALYIALGTAGLPVFAGGLGGIGRIIGPTGGYILGFAVSAFFTGVMFQKFGFSNKTRNLLILAAGIAIIFALGVLRLSCFVSLSSAIYLGFTVFVPAEIFKLGAGLALLSAVKK